MSGRLYLISCPLQDQALEASLPKTTIDLVAQLSYFLVENAKTARAFLKTVELRQKLQEIEIFEISKEESDKRLSELLSPIMTGMNAGVLSEVGAPCVADPGSQLVRVANRLGIEVKPLVGPSAIHMAIMSSGLNGQNFCFNGYLPIKSPDLENKIRELEKQAIFQQQSQFFIETPYRLRKIFSKILQICKDSTFISLACDLGSSTEFVRTKTVKDWKLDSVELEGRQAVIGIG